MMQTDYALDFNSEVEAFKIVTGEINRKVPENQTCQQESCRFLTRTLPNIQYGCLVTVTVKNCLFALLTKLILIKSFPQTVPYSLIDWKLATMSDRTKHIRRCDYV